MPAYTLSSDTGDRASIRSADLARTLLELGRGVIRSIGSSADGSEGLANCQWRTILPWPNEISIER